MTNDAKIHSPSPAAMTLNPLWQVYASIKCQDITQLQQVQEVIRQTRPSFAHATEATLLISITCIHIYYTISFNVPFLIQSDKTKTYSYADCDWSHWTRSALDCAQLIDNITKSNH